MIKVKSFSVSFFVAVGSNFMAELILSFFRNGSARTLLFTPTPVQTPYVWAEPQLFKEKSAKATGSFRRIGLDSSFLGKKVPKPREACAELGWISAFQGKKCQSHRKLAPN